MSKEALSVEDTLKLVPTEPTNNMKSAASQLFARNPKATPSDFYKVMVATAKEALAQQSNEQVEPVAFETWYEKFHSFAGKSPLLYSDLHCAWQAAKLYTTPPQRKPLTDEQIDYIYDQLVAGQLESIEEQEEDPMRIFARAIEAAHGIKE